MRGNIVGVLLCLDNLVFAEPGNQTARQLLADVYTQLGYQAESGQQEKLLPHERQKD